MNKKEYLCPRLLDYILIVGARRPNNNNDVAQTPELLRRFPREDHEDFPLPKDVVYFCQPEGCLTVGQKRFSMRENTSFVFTLTEKDTARIRFGVCVNFYRPFKVSERKSSSSSEKREKSLLSTRQHSSSSNDTLNIPDDGTDIHKSPRTRRRLKQAKKIRNNSLTSLCILSHHPFISTFRECLFILRKLIDSCNERTSSRKVGGSRSSLRDSVWGVLTGICGDIPPLVKHDVRQIETWMLRLLSAPVPVPGKTRVEIEILESQPSLVFALPDHTRFSLADFPLHLPLELLGVDTCLSVLTLIMLENKVVLQSRDYNALSMSVMAFVAMIYPLEYMFPVIPLLPTCMGSAEQLLLAPTPFIIGVPASFFRYKPSFKLPDDVWMVDLDTNKITVAGRAGHIPAFPEPEGSDLKRHLRQALASMSLNPPPIKDFDKASSREFEAISKHRSALTGETDFKPFVYGNDVDAVDVATRVAMAKFLNGANVLGNLTEHTRTLRLYPRPVVAFQVQTFLCSRPNRSAFTDQLASSQAVEYFGECSLNPMNVTFLRIQTGVYDPHLIGDKSKWFREQLQPIEFKVQFENCTLGAALSSASEGGSDSSNPTDESGEESEREDGGGSSSSSYSSLDEFVVDMMNSDIKGDVQDPDKPDQISEIDEHSIYRPPDSLQLPPDMVQSDNNQFADSDSSSSQDNPTSPDMRIAQNMSMSGIDTDQDLDSSVYDSDNMYAMTKQNRRDSNDVDSEAGSRGGRTSPTFMDKFNSLFRSDSSDSSAPTTPTKTKPKPSILRGIMDLALETAKEPIGSPTSLSSLDPNGYSPSVKSDPGPNRSRMGSGMGLPTRKKKTSSPLTRDTRRSLVERTSLIRHHSTKKPEKRSSLTSERPNSEDQLFLKEIVRGVLEGNNVGWLNWSRLKRLMQNENLRAQVISQLYPQDSAVTGDYIEDVKVNKAVYKGLCSVLKAVLAGLEYSFDNHTAGGMASAFALLEIASTHYFGKEPELNQKGEGRHRGGSLKSGAPHGQYALDELLSQQQGGHHHPGGGVGGGGGGGGMLTIASRPSESHSLNEDNFIAAIESWQKSESISSCSTSTEEGGVKVHSSSLEDNRNDSAYELIDESEIPIGSSTGAGVHGAVGIAAGIAVTDEGVIGTKLDMTPLTGVNRNTNQQIEPSPSNHNHQSSDCGEDGIQSELKDITNNNLYNTGESAITFIAPPSSTESPDIRDLMDTPTHRRSKLVEKLSSMDSELSEASTLVSFNSSDTLGNDSDTSSTSGIDVRSRRSRIAHHSIRPVMSDTEVELNGSSMTLSKRNTPARWSMKSRKSAGFRYHGGDMIATDSDTSEVILRRYVFEAFVVKDRSPLWDQPLFWEDSFLDAVAAERDAVGLDQGPAEMIHRYESLSPEERKRLEEDEDKLLSDMLYNMTAYMIEMEVPKIEIKRRIRRLLGRSHVGLLYSQDVNDLLDQINNLYGNDIDLKPAGSRQMRKHSFVVHAGSDNKGDVLFMEVCDDCVIIRSGNGAVCDRCWYERLINMTYCPKTKVLCLWRKVTNTTKLDKFYTKKCRELYFCIKESMEKAASRQKNGMTAEPELGGEFPIQDVKTGEGGLLQVTMEGVGLKFPQSKAFIELKDIKEYKTKKDIFMLVECNPQQKNVTRHKFRSAMAHDIGYAMLCVFSYLAAAKNSETITRKELEARMAGRKREFMQS
ncbi:MAP kinase-activating death domain protein-like isoform X4 [Lytechinus variegatus]|uniref:MAP kinase-activating death domain protein-like isoform X4 n=1 Tax=Lytechinus variegatus TaxID=7654 RepID=UPI001BB1B488|nr:MAP kinase-activating death domain protein-like isoform X4 [Lytechinus variegatus]